MKTCNDCVCYITDEDENGNETEYHSARGLPEGFCLIKELIYSCKATDEVCEEFVEIMHEAALETMAKAMENGDKKTAKIIAQIAVQQQICRIAGGDPRAYTIGKAVENEH